MKSVAGILTSRSAAEIAVERLRAIGLSSDRINLLTPEASKRELSKIPTTETEQPGTGSAIGGVVGGAMGAAGGMSVGMAIASLVVPGVGPVFAIGLAAAAILGAGGAVGGAFAGEALEDSMARGLPVDELFIYEDALRQGRTVIIAFPEDDAQAERTREVLRATGAESVDAARESWWAGLRDNAGAVYTTKDDPEKKNGSYRCGFETALHPALRNKPYAEAVDHLKTMYPQVYADESFRRGYRRGHTYCRELKAAHQRSQSVRL